MKCLLLGMIGALAFAGSASGTPIGLAFVGRIDEVAGPEPVGGVAVGDRFTFEITYESTAIQGIGDESIFFDGIALLDASISIQLGSEVFTETSNAGGITTLSFRDGELVGYNFRLGEFDPPSGARYFIFLENGLLIQQFWQLPLNVSETRVRGSAPVPEPGSFALLGLGLLLLGARRPG